ncbi:hypothetical protein [Methylobacterium oxalidis]|uniref:Uncharacterized protein n=1 Tax=Methylobacterium oxalidis TaxID=944322 RepID=A0A512J5M1_9HYPH|nr:hypothetical protein [Methylobacterium oxalidis]GEP05281.1 hypothetical protein MOX02_33190 [Methylobacterium oxalidis]GJE29980.1 hypothetical protein LDDCCGHA_0143 [Methylobacterium oxalidis]GLS64675.1 hypothetical protein GCM10007888_30560 [Methylobacterium oxalidis]
MDAVRRLGSYLQVQDGDGCRHLLRVTSVQALSDTDPLRNETFITAAGRTIRVLQPLDQIVELIAPGERLTGEAEEPAWPF